MNPTPLVGFGKAFEKLDQQILTYLQSTEKRTSLNEKCKIVTCFY